MLFIGILFLWLLSGLIFKVNNDYYSLLKLPFFTLNGKIINASPDDLKFILSDELIVTKMDNYNSNRINSTEAIKQVDNEAELISNFIKLVGM